MLRYSIGAHETQSFAQLILIRNPLDGTLAKLREARYNAEKLFISLTSIFMSVHLPKENLTTDERITQPVPVAEQGQKGPLHGDDPRVIESLIRTQAEGAKHVLDGLRKK